LGNLHSFCWVLYSIEDNNGLMMFNSCVTMFSISFVSYYKICSAINDHYKSKILCTVNNSKNKEINIVTVSCEIKPSK